jgi:8-oxo-dGTP diphosphatase
MQRFTIHFAVYIILEKQNEICLLKRQNTGFMDGFYSLIAGHVDGNEPATLAAIREAQEEAGIDIKQQDLQLACTVHRMSTNQKEYIDLFFKCDKWQGEIINKEPEKCAEIKFHKLINLPSNMIPYVKKVLKSINSGINYLEMDW